MPKGKQTTALAKWDEELAKQAQVAAGMEQGTGTGQFFSLKAGVLAFAGSPFPGNELACVIADGVLENVYYEGKYVEGVANAPKCFAFGRDEAAMEPHEVCVKAKTAQCDACRECRMNQWASAETGKGKACRNSRRLALIPAGSFDAQGRLELIEDEEHYRGAELAYLRLPVTSVKGYAAYVKQLAATLKRPPHGVITRVKVVPDQQTQFKVVFSAIQPVPDAVMGVIMQRHAEAAEVISFPYPAWEGAAKPAAKGPVNRAAAPAPGRGRKF
jgi:hypothetical protein